MPDNFQKWGEGVLFDPKKSGRFFGVFFGENGR